MPSDKDSLVMSAVGLYKLGMNVENARAKLKELVEQKVPYDSPEMLEALRSFRELDARFKLLEKEHIKLRDDMMENRPLQQ